MRLRRYKKKTFGSYISSEIMLIVISIICSVIIINFFCKNFNEIVMPLAEIEARKYMTEIINNATDEIKFEKNLFNMEKNEENEIIMIAYNSYESSRLVNEITYNIQNKFNSMLSDNNYVVSKIPLGVIFNNSLIRNFGPEIDVKLKIVGNIISELETEVKPYGINNALVEVRVKLSANARVILPFSSDDINIVNVIPISINIVNGSVPEAYISTYNKHIN